MEIKKKKMKTFGVRTDVRKLIKRFIANTATTIAAANKQPVATQRRLFFALREKKIPNIQF